MDSTQQPQMNLDLSKTTPLSTPSGGDAAAFQVFAELTGIDTAQMIKINVADWPGVTSS